MVEHLVIGDPHAGSADEDNYERFFWAGNLCVARKPDVIVCIGDFADMNSLCSYDRGTRSYEGRRYKYDIEGAILAQDYFFKPIVWYNMRKKRNGKKQYKPRFVMLGGNHDEGRIEKVTQLDPMLHGTISLDDLQYKDFGWEYHNFLDHVEIDGILYSHYFTSGVMGRPISSIHTGYQLIIKNHMSCTQGHSHLFDHKTGVRADGSIMNGLSVGCYTDPSRTPEYARGADKFWWSGLCYKHNVKNGEYDLETISYKRVKELYG